MKAGEKQDVFKVYDNIATWFAKNRVTGLKEKKYLDEVLAQLPDDAQILDLGCGTGKPILEYLVSKNANVTGVDASDAMLTIARSDFLQKSHSDPQIEFILQDMRLLKLNQKFDAIIAWHSFFHLPIADQPAMFERFAEHLNPNGILVFTSGPQHGEVWGMNGGENLFHASLDPQEYEALLIKHRFRVLSYQESDPDCYGDTVWMAKYIPW